MRYRLDRTIVYIAGFLFSVPLALTSYVNSSFLEEYTDSKYVGSLYIMASLVTVFALMQIPQVMQRIGNRRSAMWLSLGLAISFLLMGIDGSGILAIPAFIGAFVTSSLLITCLDVFVENYTRGKSIGRSRGIYLTAMNVAWVVAQPLSGSIISKSSFHGIYIFSCLFMFLVTFIFGFFLHNFQDPEYRKVKLRKTIRTFIRRANLHRAYLINLILKFFYAWMVIYTPIYLHENMGFGWDKIGIIFSFMLLPFVLVTFPLGNLSDKIGEKKMLIYGFVINIAAIALMPFIKSPTLYLWAIVLFATRVGAATIEVMNESYFFKVVKEEEADEVAFFRNTQALAYLLAPALAIPVFIFTPSFEYIFFVLVAIMLVGLLITLRLRDVK